MPVDPRTSGRRAWTVVTLLLLFMAINFMDKTVLGLAGKEIRADLELSNARFGLIGSAFFALFSISGVAGGFLATKVPVKWLLAVMVALWSASQAIAAVPFGDAGVVFIVLMITRIVLGFAEGPAFPLANHTAFGWFPNVERGIPGSLISIGSAAGVAVGAPLLAVVIITVGWRAAFAVTAALGAIWLVVWSFAGAEGPYSGAAGAGHVPSRRLFLRRTVIGGVLGGLAAYWMLSVAITWLPQFLQNVHDYSLRRVSLVGAGILFVGIAATLAFGVVSQRMMKSGSSSHLARGVLSGAALIVSGCGIIAMTRAGNGVAFGCAMVVAFAIGQASFALVQAALAEVTPAAKRSVVLCTVIGVASMAGAFGPYLTGVLIDRGDSVAAGYQNAFDVGGVVVIIGGILTALLVNPDLDKEPHGAA